MRENREKEKKEKEKEKKVEQSWKDKNHFLLSKNGIKSGKRKKEKGVRK